MGQRYYSPELCRFIQPDSIEYLDPSSINGLNLYCYCFNNPIMYYDPSGHAPEWVNYLCWGLAAGIVIGAGIALMIASGGSAAIAFSALSLAANGLASSTVALTVTSYLFLGTSIAFATSAAAVIGTSYALESGPDVLLSTVAAGVYSGYGGYYSWNQQIGTHKSWPIIQKNYWKEQGYDSTPIGPDGYPMELNHPYGRFGSKIEIFEPMTHTEHVEFHRIYGTGRGNGGFNRYYGFDNIWKWISGVF